MIVELNATAVQVEVSTFSLLRKTKPWGNCCFQGPGGWRCSWVSRILTTCAVLVWSKQYIPITLTSGVWGSRVRSSRSPSHKWSYTGCSRPVRDTRDPVWKTNQPHNKSKSRLLKWKGFALTLGTSEYLLPVGRTNYLSSMIVTREGGIPKTSQLCRSSFFRISPWL